MGFIIQAVAGTFIEKLLQGLFGMFQEWMDDNAREELGATRTAAETSAKTAEVKERMDKETNRETDPEEWIRDLEAGRF